MLLLLIRHSGSDNYALAEGEPSDSAAEEKLALLEWKTGLEGFNSEGALSSWTPESEPCHDWKGITCNAGLVLTLELASQGLRGTLPQELSALTILQQISVKFNQLSGPPIPSSWTALQRLMMIDATNNELTGSLLSDGGGIPPRLNTLQLQNNRIRGTLPSRLGRLQYLALGSNHLTGTLPESWAEDTGLMSIKLGDNRLRGPLPEEWSALDDLRFLELQDNRLTGQLPPGWTSLSSMRFMELFNNHLDVAQLEEVGRELGARADWVLLPQRSEEEEGGAVTGARQFAEQSSNADEARLFSAAPADWSPKVVRRGGMPYPAVVAIAVGVTLGLSLVIIALLIRYSVAAVRAHEVQPLLMMTNLEDACHWVGDEQKQQLGSGMSVINVRGDSTAVAESCIGSRITKRSSSAHAGAFLAAKPPPMMGAGTEGGEGAALEMRSSPSRHHSSSPQRHHHGAQA